MVWLLVEDTVKNMHFLRLVATAGLLVLPSCDLMYSPVLCNGYNMPVVVTSVFGNNARKRITKISSGECKAEDPIVGAPRSDSNTLRNEVTVEAVTGEIVARYSEQVNEYARSGRSFTPHWLLSDKGLFFIPRKFENNWQGNIPVIEKTGQFFIPNQLKVQ